MLAFMVASPAMALRSDGLLELVKAELRPSSYLLKSPSAAPKIEEACKNLEAEGTRPAWPRDLMLLDGRWKLVYSSALALPLPPIEPISGPLAGLLEELPFAPREVEQRIDVEQRRVINVVRLSAWPSGGPAQLLSALPGIGGAISALQSAIVQLELDHNFRVEGEGGSSGGLRKAAAGSVVELQLEQLRRTLAKQEDAESDDWDDGWNDMLNPQVRLPSFYSLFSLRFLRLMPRFLHAQPLGAQGGARGGAAGCRGQDVVWQPATGRRAKGDKLRASRSARRLCLRLVRHAVRGREGAHLPRRPARRASNL